MTTETRTGRDHFSHEALFYAGPSAFVEGVVRFVSAGLERDERVMVMVGRAKLGLISTALGSSASQVQLVDMEHVGKNPARIIPAWADFFGEHAEAGRSSRGVGEPIWPERTEEELLECQLHESLINLAFSDATGTLMCPYDVSALDASTIAEARRGHPHILEPLAVEHNPDAHECSWLDPRFDAPLPNPPASMTELRFDRASVAAARQSVSRFARSLGLTEAHAEDVALAAHELAANSVVHAGGQGRLRLWRDDRALVCEVSDTGCIGDPLVGRRRPAADALGGRGIWMVHNLTDLTQIRTGPRGTAVRFRVALGAAPAAASSAT